MQRERIPAVELTLPSHELWCAVFPVLFVSHIFLIFLWIFSWTPWLFGRLLFKFHILVIFLFFLLINNFWVETMWSEKMFVIISDFLNLLRLVCALTYGLSWRKFHVCWRSCILLLLDEMFYYVC